MKLTAPQKKIVDTTKKVNLFLAGQGSGKTHIMALITALYVSNFPKALGLICANTFPQLNQATLKVIRKVWNENLGIAEYLESNPNGNYVIGIIPPKHFKKNHVFKDYSRVISFSNGASLVYGSLDNYKALDGMEIAYALIDETKDTKEEAVKEVILGRLRQKAIWIDDKGVFNNKERGKGFNPLFMFTSPAKVQWLNEWFELDKFESDIKSKIFSETDFFSEDIGNKRIVISSTFHNKKNLPSSYIPDQMENLTPELQEMLIYGSPFSRTGGEFYKEFDRDKHVADNEYNPNLPLHISFDENVNPYISLTIWQTQGTKAQQINEICLPNPRNTLEHVCNEFKGQYPNHQSGLFIYGDRTSLKEDTKLEKGQNFFILVQGYLSSYRPSLRLPSHNPSVVMRANWINTIFYNNIDEIEISIGRNCTNTIADYVYLKEDGDGTKKKSKVTDKQTGVSYEKYGHTSDANDYLLTMLFDYSYQKYIQGGKMITPKIYKSKKRMR